MIFKRTLLFWGLLSICWGARTPEVLASSFRPDVIYKQARSGNLDYLRRLSRYRGAIDFKDMQGNTAYCLALGNNDKEALALLKKYGANSSQKCAKDANERRKARYKRQAERNYQAKPRFKESAGFFENDSTYYWTAAGVIAAGAGVAALAGGGGGGKDSSHVSGDVQTPGGDITKPSGNLVNMAPNEFRTKEYQRTNFLEGIKAADAYSHIFRKDQSGVILGHQANSDAALKKIKVGILDSGVYANKDLAGKIVAGVDANPHNNDGSVWGVSRDGWGQGYIIKQDGEYYLFKIDDKFRYYLKEDGVLAYSEKEMRDIVEKNWKIPFEELTLINVGDGYNPGTDMNYLVTDLDNGERKLVESWLGVVEGLTHGTHVAGIVAANKNGSGMHGVAFDNAEIVAASWDLEQDVYAVTRQLINKGATVLNNSWGADVTTINNAATAERLRGTSDLAAYVYAAKNGAVWVQATGNESKHESNIHTGMGLLDLSNLGYNGPKKYEAPLIAVTALDYDTRTANAPSGKLASYANWCGSTAGYCLAAPGTSVDSTAPMKDGVINMSGTSMATPVVSGSIALLNGYYPWLSAQNIAYLLLETANNKGEYADSAKYGQGALDLEAAVTTPIGGLGLPTQSSFSSIVPVSGSKLALSSAVQQKLMASMPEQVTAFDALNRPFQYDMKNVVNKTHASNANLRNAVSRIASGQSKRVVKDEKTGFQFVSEETLDKGGKNNLALAEITSETSDGATRFYYTVNSKYMSQDNVLAPSSNPYLAMNEAYGAENMLKLSDTSKFKISLQTGENGLYERDYEQDKHSFDGRAYAFSGEYSFGLTDYLEVATLGGMLYEDNALLGMNGSGAFGIKDSSTYYMGVRAALNLTPEILLSASYYRGYTQGAEAPMLAISDLETESFTLAGEYMLNKTDKVGLSFSSPLSVVKGKASLMYASGRDSASDTIYMQKLTTSLKPRAKEYDVGLYYQGKTEEEVSLTGKVSARFNADGEKGVTDYIGIVGVSAAF